MINSLPTLNKIIICLSIVSCVAASVALPPLGKVATLSGTRRLRHAWRALALVVVTCIVLQIMSLAVSSNQRLNIQDLFNACLHFAGSTFVLCVSYLSLATAKSLLRIHQLEIAAHTDPLTGALNRAGFFAAVGSPQTNVGIIMADLDHFKRINDRLGHEAGDYVLRCFVKRARDILPCGSSFARFGGEEFVIALPGASLDATFGFAERLRIAANAHKIDWPGEPVPITVSFGVSVASPEQELAVAIARADKALYGAKHEGRDQVRVG